MNSLNNDQIQQFIEEGFVRLDKAFPRDLADEGRAILWRHTGCDPDDPTTWTKPVVWLGDHDEEPFRRAVNTPRLHAAFDQLVGKGRWEPRHSLGTFPVRFPSQEDTGDTGWHVDASFAGEDSDSNDFLSWRVNVNSRGRALLLLFLFSDVGEKDAPTRIRVGSHLEVAKMLEPAGEAGMTVEGAGSNPGGNRWALRGDRHRGSGDRVSLPPLPGSCGPDQSWNATPFHGSAATVYNRTI